MPLTRIVFDADMILFLALSEAEQQIEWYDNFFTLHLDMNDAIVAFDEKIKDIVGIIASHWDLGAFELIMCLSAPNGDYFRKDLYKDYKSNRKRKRKPLCYLEMQEWIKDNYNTIQIPKLEADDCCGLMSGDNVILVSGDKDFRSIPCRLYDFMRGEFLEISEEEADKFHLLQTLVGDSTDNYKGCPKIGEVRAKRILDQDPTWENVVKTYKLNGSDEQEALLNARLSFILRPNYYDMETKEIKLWKPNDN